jgi:hypothetical protein
MTESEKSLLSREQMNSMYQPYIQVSDGVDYGLAWFVEKFGDATLISHPGSADGYRAYVSFIPEKNIGIVAIGNQHATSYPDKVARAAYTHLLGSSFKANDLPNTEETSGVSVSTSNFAPAHALTNPATVEKSFWNCSYGEMVISKENDQNFLMYGPNKWMLVPNPTYGFVFEVFAYGQKMTVPLIYSGDGQSFVLPMEPTSDFIPFVAR